MLKHDSFQYMKKRILLIIVLCLVIKPFAVNAQDVYVDKADTAHKNNSLIVLPFSFYLKTLGISAAVDVAGRGFLQDQTSSTLIGLISTNGSRYIYGDMTNLQVPFAKRMFVSPNINIAHYGALDVYYDGYRSAGKNKSSSENFYRIQSNKYEVELLFRYLLPLGYGRNEVLNQVVLDKGIPEQGRLFSGSYWPVVNGRTFVEPGLFYQNQYMQAPFNRRLVSAGYTLGLTCENVDFVANPSVGDVFNVKFRKGTSALSSTTPWDMLEGSASFYFPVPSSWLKQQVLAFNVWTRYVSSWDDASNGLYHRPSPFAGANLGGRFRLRGFPEARFSDRAALLYTGEYRIIPKWTPLANWGLLKSLGVKLDWMQVVVFGEAGRVAPDWDLDTFHQKMKTDAGMGLRFMANQMIVRIDGAYSTEGLQCQMYINHAF